MTRRTNSLLVCYIALVVLVAGIDKAASTTASQLRGVESVSRTTCPTQVRIAFEFGGAGGKLINGQYITTQYQSNQGVTISGSGNGAQILNTTTPGTYESLGSPNSGCSKPGPGVGSAGGPGKPGQNCQALGNVLYVAGTYNVPRTIKFQFNQPRYVQSIGVLDIKSGANVVVSVQLANGQLQSVTAAGRGDNAVQSVSIFKDNVKAITVKMNTGAITYLDFCKGTSVASPTAAPVAKPQGICATRNYIKFGTAANGAKLAGGQYVMNEWLAYGVSVMAYPISGGLTPNSKPRLFDTSNPGNAKNLGSPNKQCPSGGSGVGVYGQPGQLGQNCVALGKVLIVQHSSVSTPDASTGGAIFTFRFTRVKKVTSFGLFNVPLKDSVTVTVNLADGTKKIVYVRGNGVNGYKFVSLNVPNANKLTIYLPTTGAITHLDICGAAASPTKAPVQNRDGPTSPLSIPVGSTPAPSPYATVDDNGMFRPADAPQSFSARSIDGGGDSTPAPSPYETVNDNGMFGRD